MITVELSKDKLRDAFCKFIRPWRGRYLPSDVFADVGDDIGVPVDDLCKGIRDLRIADEPLPPEAVRKLELFEGATYGHAADLLLWAWTQPVELTPEEEAQEEMEMLAMSEIIEQFNSSMAPADVRLPVLYSKDERTKH